MSGLTGLMEDVLRPEALQQLVNANLFTPSTELLFVSGDECKHVAEEGLEAEELKGIKAETTVGKFSDLAEFQSTS